MSTGKSRRIAQGERADVRDDGEAVGAVDSVNAETSLPPTSGPTTVTNAYAVPPMNATSVVPPMPMIDAGRPLANVVISPVFGSTREILPTADSVT